MTGKTGRPSKNESGHGDARIVSFRLPQEMYKRLEECAKKNYMTKTAIIEMGVILVLDELENTKGD